MGFAGNLPQTFQDRGATIPFEHEDLRAVRARKAGKAIEVSVSGLFAGESTYVMPLSYLTSVVRLSFYDRQLMDQIVEANATAPEAIWKIALAVQASGAGGVTRQHQAKAELKQLQDIEMLMLWTLISRAIVVSEQSSGPAMHMAEILQPGAREKLKQRFAGLAQRTGKTPEVIFKQLESWAELMNGVGLGKPEGEGRLRRLRADMATLIDEIVVWKRNQPPEVAGATELLVRIIKETVNFADIRLAKLDHMIDDGFEKTVRAWRNDGSAVKEEVADLGWLLDGWAAIVEMWASVRDGSMFDQRDAVEQMGFFAPLLPQEAIMANKVLLQAQEWQLRRFVAARQDWLTGATVRLDTSAQPGDA